MIGTILMIIAACIIALVLLNILLRKQGEDGLYYESDDNYVRYCRRCNQQQEIYALADPKRSSFWYANEPIRDWTCKCHAHSELHTHGAVPARIFFRL